MSNSLIRRVRSALLSAAAATLIAAPMAVGLFATSVIVAPPAPVSAACLYSDTTTPRDASNHTAYTNGDVEVYVNSSNNSWCQTYNYQAFGERDSSVTWARMGVCNFKGSAAETDYFFRSSSSSSCSSSVLVANVYDPPTYGEGWNNAYYKYISCSNFVASTFGTYNSWDQPSGCNNGGNTAVGSDTNVLFVDTKVPAAPTGDVTSGTNSYQSAANATIYIRGGTAGSFVLNSNATDASPSSGLVSNTFSAPASTSGWTTTTAATVGSDPASRTYSFGSSAVSTTFTIRGTDRAGNAGTTRTMTVTSDAIGPALTISAPPAATIKTTTSPTFTVTVSDAGAGFASGTWTRQWATLAADTCGATWNNDTSGALAAGAQSPAQTALTAGRCYRWTAVATDNVGNQSSGTSEITKVDTAAPSSSVSSPTYSTSRTVSTSWTASDVHTDVASTNVLWSPTNGGAGTSCGTPQSGTSGNISCTVSADGTFYFGSRSTDSAGNVETLGYNDQTIVDTVPPTFNGFTAPIVDPTLRNSTSFTFVWNAATDATSGVKDYQQVRQSAPLNGVGSCSTSWSNVTDHGRLATTSIVESGLSNGTCYREAVRVYDNAGNVSSWNYSMAILVSTSGATGSVLINGGAAITNSSNVTLTISATDTQVGVVSMRFSNDGVTYGSWVAYDTSYPWTLAAGNGVRTVYVQFLGGSGVTSPAYSDSITVDTSAVTGTVLINDGATATSSVAVSLALVSAGSTQVKLSNDGVSYGSWTAITSPMAWNLAAGPDGVRTVYAIFRNAALTESAVATDTIILDTSGVSGSINIDAGADATASTSVTLTLDATGATEMRFSNDGVTYDDWTAYSTSAPWVMSSGADGVRTVYVIFRNAALTESAPASDSIDYDTTAPDISADVTGAGGPTDFIGDVTVTINATDALSGVSSVTYELDGGSTLTYSGAFDVTEIGSHTVVFRAVDAAGNVAPDESVTFTISDPVGLVVGAYVYDCRAVDGQGHPLAPQTIVGTDISWRTGAPLCLIPYATDSGWAGTSFAAGTNPNRRVGSLMSYPTSLSSHGYGSPLEDSSPFKFRFWRITADAPGASRNAPAAYNLPFTVSGTKNGQPASHAMTFSVSVEDLDYRLRATNWLEAGD